MTRKPYIESLICALQNRGGYGCHAVIDNPSDKIYRALSWLLAAASAFVYSAIGSALGVVAELPSRHLFCFCQWSGKYPPPLHFTPYALARSVFPTEWKERHPPRKAKNRNSPTGARDSEPLT